MGFSNQSGQPSRVLIILGVLLVFMACGVVAIAGTLFYLRQDPLGGGGSEAGGIVIPTLPTRGDDLGELAGEPQVTPFPTPVTPVLQTVPASEVVTPEELLLPATATLAADLQTPTPRVTGTPVAAVDTSIVTAPRLASPPALDGNLADWPINPNAFSNYTVYSAPSWNGSDDITVSWRIGWTDQALFVAADVTDDVIAQTQTGNLTYLGDSLELQFDTNINADFGFGVTEDDFQIEISPGNFAGLPAEAYRFRGTPGGTHRDDPGHAIVVVSARSGAGYIIEARIPWGDLSITPSAGLQLGANLNVNDNDSPGVALQELMKSNVSTRTYRDPQTWGRLILGETR